MIFIFFVILSSDTRDHVLACFGGAGGQHACAIARSLGMDTVYVHKYAGILSAYGMALADVIHEEQAPCVLKYNEVILILSPFLVEQYHFHAEVISLINPKLNFYKTATLSKTFFVFYISDKSPNFATSS